MTHSINHPALQQTLTDQPAIYVGTYAKYNNGSLFGAWIDMTEISSKDEFYERCAQLHDDETDPEYMFQDWQSIPEGFIGESWLLDQIFDAIEVQQATANYDDEDWINLHNQYCRESENYDDEFLMNDEDFFNTYFEGKPDEAVRAAIYGDYRYMDEYVKFNGYGNLESFNKYEAENRIDKDEIIKHVIENRYLYDL